MLCYSNDKSVYIALDSAWSEYCYNEDRLWQATLGPAYNEQLIHENVLVISGTACD